MTYREKNKMIRMIKVILMGLFFLSLTACSYSPNALKEAYAGMATDLSDELKELVDLTPTQATKVDHYTDELLKWHRKNKLPEYSQTFLVLASYVQQGDISTQELQKTLGKLEATSLLSQAKHLAPLLIDLVRSLSDSQISQLEKSLKNDYQKNQHEMKTENMANDMNEDIKHLFGFMRVSLNAEQKKILKAESKKFYNLHWVELQHEKQWNKRFIALLKRSNSPQFNQQFTQLWDSQSVKYEGKALQQKRLNEQRQAKLFKTLIMKFSAEKRNRLASQLISISSTLSEMANQ